LGVFRDAESNAHIGFYVWTLIFRVIRVRTSKRSGKQKIVLRYSYILLSVSMQYQLCFPKKMFMYGRGYVVNSPNWPFKLAGSDPEYVQQFLPKSNIFFLLRIHTTNRFWNKRK
jgi:hypothetical protein